MQPRRELADGHLHPISRRHFLMSAMTSAGALLLTACGGRANSGSNPTAATTPAPSTAASFTPAASPTAQRGPSGSIAIGTTSEPNTMDPLYAPGSTEYNVLINVMDGLATTGDKLAVVPRLAQSWKQLDDLTWEFALQRGVKFHNGEPFNAESVKFSYDRSMDKTLNVRNTWGDDINLDHVEIVDDYTVRFHTTDPTPHLLARIANDHFMLPPKYVGQTDPTEVARHPIGTGAYVFKKWNTGQEISLEANPDYWGEPKPSVKNVGWRWIPEDTTRLGNLKTGAIDLMLALPPSSINEVKGQDDLDVVSIQTGRRVYVAFNTKSKPMDDVRVRQALNYGTNVEAICTSIMGGTAHRMRTWVESPYENPDVKGYSYDPEKAKQLLQEAGLGDGFKVAMDTEASGLLKIDEFPAAIATSLHDIGVQVDIKVEDGNIHLQKMKDRTTSPMDVGSIAPYFDPGLTFKLFAPDHSLNPTQWEDQAFLDLKKKMDTGGTPEQRLQWSYEAQVEVMQQAPMLFLWKQPAVYGINRRIQNFRPNGDERIRILGLSLSH